MLKNLSFYLLLTLFSIANQALYAQSLIATINVTSGVDNTGAYLGEGLTDPNWVIADSPDYPGSPVPAITCPYIAGYWVPTPMPVTNAGWLNATAVLGTQTPGFYSFERTFTVPAGTDIMSLNFNLAADDTLTALVLVPPTGPDIPLTVAFTVPNQYYPSTLPVPGNIVSPVAGTWKIRATAWYIDALGAFLASGNIKCYKSDCLPDRSIGASVGSQININTGVDASLSMLPFGTLDPRWSIVGSTLPPVSTLYRWNYSPASSVWIGFDNNQGTNETNYQVKFEFCTEVCGDYRLNFRMMADNGACVYLDGNLVPSSWWASGTPIPDCNFNPGDQSPFIPTAGYHVDYTTNLSAGIHTLLVDVTNFAGSLSSINVMGGIELVSICPPSTDCLPDRSIAASVGSQININTGVDASLSMLPFGTLDPRWSIVGSTLPPVSTLDRWNYSPASSVWIGFDNNQGTNETNYQVKFEFCTEVCGDYRLNFRMMADNGACVYLDGNLVPSSWWASGTPIPDCNFNPGDQSPFIPTAGYHVDYTTNLSAGIHTLLVDVTNFAGSLSSINVMGGIELVSICPPSTDCLPDRSIAASVGSHININTGVDASLSMLPFGTLDPRWSIVGSTLPPVSTLNRWNYSPASSVWIGFDNNQGTNETNYQVKFEFCTEVCGDYRLNFRMMADNGACVYLDGNLVPSSWWASGTPIPDCNFNPGDQSPFIPTAGYHVDYTTKLLAGIHTLLVDVTNSAGSLSSINVMGGIELVLICPSAVKNATLFNDKVQIFPNPVSDVLTVSWDMIQLQSIRIIDMWGRVLITQTVDPSVTQQSINAFQLPAGTFILSGQNETGTVVSKRFVKLNAE